MPNKACTPPGWTRKPVTISSKISGSTAAAHAKKKPSIGGYKHLVVIYEENHSFDNLYGTWGRVGKGR